MTKEQFEKDFGEQLNLSEKKWMLMSPKANKDNNLVIISGYRELDFDYLYFFYKDELWEMYLDGNIRYYEGVPYTTRELFILSISNKKTLEYHPPGNSIIYRSSGVKGQVIVALDYFATKIKSVLDPVTIKVPKEVQETKSITPKTIDDLGLFLIELGYPLSIVENVRKSIKPEKMCVGGEWNLSYIDDLIETAKQAEELQIKSWEEFNKEIVTSFSEDVTFKIITSNICELLEYKNNKYGNSALQSLEIFSGKSKMGNRIDDKLARIKNSEKLQKNDVADIIGYLILVCKENNWTTFDEFKD